MNHISRIILTAFIIIAAAYSGAMAQTDTLGDLRLFRKSEVGDITAGDQLRALQSLYSAGKYSQALALSRQIQEQHSLSKDDNILRLKYTIAAYKDLDCNREADSAAKIFIQRAPFYEVSVGGDPVSFQEVVGNYYAMPKFALWAAAGKVFIKPQLDTVYSILASEQPTPSYDAEGYMVQIGFEYRPLRILSVSVAPMFGTAKIERTTRRSDISTLHCNEDCRAVAVPLFIEATLFAGRSVVNPSIYAGAQARYLISSKSQVYEETIGSYTKIPDFADNLDIKNRLNTSVLGGVRLYANTRGRIAFFGDFGFAYDLHPHNAPSKKFDNHALMFNKSYVPDIYHLLDYTAKIGVKVNLQYKTVAKYKYGY